MPVLRNAKALGPKVPRAAKGGPAAEHGKVEQEESCQAKRSPSSPQGAPKKRSAFGDITNAPVTQAVVGKKETSKAGTRKKAPAALDVSKNNEINQKKSSRKTPPKESPAEPTKDPVPEEPEPVLVVEDIDQEQLGDPYASAEYAKEIFDYMREREEKFVLPNYMEKQTDISGDMRAILVDWMVEVQ
ncbi:CCNB3 protein, partial [Crypturellus soui]|nr:CCNB3 protein [Crypturellus soui]